MAVQKNFVVKNGIEVNTSLIFADTDSNKVGIATTGVNYTLHVNGGIGATHSVVTGVSTVNDITINGRITAGSSTGASGQYLVSTGAGITWASIPKIRNVDNQVAIAGTDRFSTVYTVGLLDVYINGVRLSEDEFTANDSATVILDDACFGGETVEFISYSTAVTGVGGSSIQGITILEEGTPIGSPLQVTSLNFVGASVTAVGAGVGVTVYINDNTNANYWGSTAAGIHTLSNVGLGTTNPRYYLEVGPVGYANTALWVNGNARVTGILTVGTSSIILDGDTNIINVGNGVTINGTAGTVAASFFVGNGSALTGVSTISSQWVSTAAGIHTLSNVGIGTTNPTSALSVSGDVNVSGVITASSFVGDGSGLIGVIGAGSGVVVLDDGSIVGTASTINFGEGISVSPISSGIVTASVVGYATEGYVDNKVGIATSGLLSSTGSGVSLTGIVTSITAGSGISVNQNTGNVIISVIPGGDIGYASTAGIATYATSSGIATYATTSGVSTYATSSDIATYASTAGIATYATTSGVSTYATSSGIATYATTSGVSTYATSSDIATYASTAGIATYATSSGIATYASTAGIATYATSAGLATSAGTATTATNLSDAANIVTGTINKDRISTTNALTVLGDLYVSNNISFGGTTTQLNTQQLQIVDADIVLGIGTTFNSTDNTANHGGIAIASTEGTPLVDLNIVPEETNPSTYKKMMWFKGDTIGAGLTDAWLFNYAVGIGSTQVPNTVRLAAGNVKFTEFDLSTVRDINASGIITATSFSGNASSATYSSSAGIATYATTAGVSTSVIGGIGSISQLSVSGVSTFTSGPVLIGSGSSTGIASQTLQVTGGAYVSGNLGVGATNPSFKLDVTGVVRLGNSVAQGNPSTSDITTNAHTILSGQGGNYLSIGQYPSYAQWIQSAFSVPSTATYNIVLQPLGGNVGIATASPSERLHVVGNILASGNVTGYSDKTLKDNIQTISNALNKVSQLRGVEFDRNDVEGNPHQIGVIAQEVEKIIPEVVTTHEDGIKSVAYGNLVGLLIEAIKDLKDEVSELKAQLKEI
jgi:hypothetical protein